MHVYTKLMSSLYGIHHLLTLVDTCAQTHLDEQFLQFSGWGFVTLAHFTVHRFICVYLCVFCVFSLFYNA